MNEIHNGGMVSASSDNQIIDIEHISNQATSGSNQSIPQKLRKWYSHGSFRILILSSISSISVLCVFGGVFGGVIDPCTGLSFISSTIALFVPSPLQSYKTSHE